MATSRGRIVVGVDGSANSAAALRWALGESELRRDRVVALLAWGYVPPGHAGDGRTFETYTASQAAAALAAVVDDAVGAAAAGEVEQQVVGDLPRTALLEAATGADLLVVGARGVGGFRGLMLGSVAQACLHHTSVPLAIVRAPEDGTGAPVEHVPGGGTGGRIVVGVDESGSARRALRWALDEARRRAAGVEVVHAWQAPTADESPLAILQPDADAFEKNARAALDRVVDAEDTGRHPVRLDRILARGGTARIVLETATGADLIVLGTRGLGGFRGLLLGSVTHHVAHHARCPLVVVR